MKPKLYLESTVPSYHVARPSRDIIKEGQQIVTRDWWDQRRSAFDIYISETVVDEVSAGEPEMARKRVSLIRLFPILATTEAVIRLADALIHSGPLPAKAARDAAHIACSAVHGMDFLMTWNCAHIANAHMYPRMRQVCEAHGFGCPVICTPSELLAH